MYWVIQYFASGLQNYGLAYVQWTYLQEAAFTIYGTCR